MKRDKKGRFVSKTSRRRSRRAKRRTRDSKGRFVTKRKKNPGRRRRTRRTRDSKGRFVSKKRRSSTTRKRRSTSMAKRKRDSKGRFVSKGRRKSKSRRRRRSYRRNPKFKPMETLTEGAVGALAATIGKASARAIPQQLGLPTTGTVGIATQAVVALAVGMAADRIAPKQGPFVVAGALMGPIETAIKAANIPVLSPALASYPYISPSGARASLPSGRPNGLASYYQGGDLSSDPMFV